MADIIKLLPDHVANQIAAGEVVQRPASVVKELLENAIDAGATRIELRVKQAGKTNIEVRDNGSGMSTTDARMAFERHATSKISDAQDLFKLDTKGFRGEAIASIAAVSHMSCKTKRSDEELGTHIEVAGSEVQDQKPVVTPDGTLFQVRNLFYNIPARRNFLKSDNSELKAIIDEFQRVAMPHPDIAFTLHHNDAEVFNLPASDLKRRIASIFGGKSKSHLVAVNEDTPIIKISGFVGKPEWSRKSRGLQYFFVNQRFVRHGYLHHAVMSAFEGLLKPGNLPTYFLFLEIPKDRMDINIHPSKTEVKFDNEHDLYAVMRSAVKHALGQFQVAGSLDFERDATMDVSYASTKRSAAEPTVTVDRNFNPFADQDTGRIHVAPSSRIGSASSSPSESRQAAMHTQQRQAKSGVHWESLYVTPQVEVAPELLDSIMDKPVQAAGNLLYQLQNKFLLTTMGVGLIVIHQNRAHQRVIYENLLLKLTVQQGVSQQLLFPLPMSFETGQLALLMQQQEPLRQIGFHWEQMEDGLHLTGIPQGVTETQVNRILHQLVQDLADDLPETKADVAHHLAISLARSMAIAMGDPMSREAQEDLVSRLFACTEPGLSPHHKKTFITLDAFQLQSSFD